MAAGPGQQGRIPFLVHQISMQADESGIRKGTCPRPFIGKTLVFRFSIGNENIEEMQLEDFRCRRFLRPFYGQIYSGSLRIKPIRVLGKESWPFQIIAAAPVSVAERMAFPSGRADEIGDDKDRRAALDAALGRSQQLSLIHI